VLVVVRHGSTKLNGPGGDDKFRGWKDIPLSPHGRNEAMNTADKLKQFNIPIENHFTSPLKRAVQTSDEISNELGSKFEKNDGLKDWHIGEFEGKSVSSNLQAIHHYIDNPDERVPGGESYNQFLGRVVPFLKDLVENGRNDMAVTHNRLTTLLHAMAESKGQGISKKILKQKGPIEPGGIMMIHPDWSTQILDKGSKNEA
jgi:broad specificity phosphatase PhoE